MGRRRCCESRAACSGARRAFDLGASRRPSLRRSSVRCPRAGRRFPNTDGCAVYGAGRRRTGHEDTDVDSGAPLPLEQRGSRAFIDDIEQKRTAAGLVHVLSMRPQVPGTTEALRTRSGGGARARAQLDRRVVGAVTAAELHDHTGCQQRQRARVSAVAVPQDADPERPQPVDDHTQGEVNNHTQGETASHSRLRGLFLICPNNSLSAHTIGLQQAPPRRDRNAARGHRASGCVHLPVHRRRGAVDLTPVECGRSRETTKRSDLTGWAKYRATPTPTCSQRIPVRRSWPTELLRQGFEAALGDAWAHRDRPVSNTPPP